MWHAAPWMDQKIGEWMEDHFPILNVYTVVVTNENGKRLTYIGPISIDNQHEADSIAMTINLFIANNSDWQPRDKYWTPIHPVYGSPEYIDTNEEANWAAQERELDEFGPDIRLAYVS